VDLQVTKNVLSMLCCFLWSFMWLIFTVSHGNCCTNDRFSIWGEKWWPKTRKIK